MLAADAGVKWRGLAVNGQYFFRWLNRFRADGPIPVASTFDHGFETVVGAFVVPKKWELYGRTSFVFGAIPLSTRPASSGIHSGTTVAMSSQRD